jgi:CheY-like chemotaxis protein
MHLLLPKERLNTTKDDETMPDYPHILIIDDRPLIIDLLCEALERQGLPVSIATSGQDALRQRFRRHPHHPQPARLPR